LASDASILVGKFSINIFILTFIFVEDYRYEEIDVPVPQAGEVLVKVRDKIFLF
jgi:hypothetical protein